MIKICRSSLAATLAALMLTVPIVAADDSANQAGGNDVTITKIRLKLHIDKEFPKYLGSDLTAPEEIVEEYQAGYKIGNNSYLGPRILKDVKLEYVTQNHKPYQDKIVWPLKKNAQGYAYDESKALALKLTFSVGEDGGQKYKIDVRKELPVEIGVRQFTIAQIKLEKGPDGRYTAYLPLKAYRKVKFIPDKGFEKFYLKGKTPELTNSLEYDVDLEKKFLHFIDLYKEKFAADYKTGYSLIGLQVETKNNNLYFIDLIHPFSYRNLDELNKADAQKPLVIHIKTRKGENDPQLPPILNGKDVTIKEGAKFDKLSLVELFKEVVGQKAEGDKSKIVFTLPAGFNPDNPTHGTYKVTMSFKNEANGLEASWISTVTVVGNPKPPVPSPQPEQKQQEKTGNAYFDLGRYLLPTCPDSKCAKTETGAKKDDVPNTAAAVNN